MRSPGFSSHRLIFYIRIRWLWVCMIIAVEALQDLLPYIFFLFVSAQTQMFQMRSRGCRSGLPEQDMIYTSLSFNVFKPILSRYAVLRGHHAFVTHRDTPKNCHSPNVMHGVAALSGKPKCASWEQNRLWGQDFSWVTPLKMGRSNCWSHIRCWFSDSLSLMRRILQNPLVCWKRQKYWISGS